METTVIDLVSDDEDAPVKKQQKVNDDTKSAMKRTSSCNVNGNDSPAKKIRRIQPTKIGEIQVEIQEKKANAAETVEPFVGVKEVIDEIDNTLLREQTSQKELVEEVPELTVELEEEPIAGPSKATQQPKKNELTKEMLGLIAACRTAENSTEMKQVIQKKLLKYYHSVHPDYVTSNNFRKTLKQATEEVLKEPHLVYMKLKVIVEELDARRKSKATVVTREDSVSINGTGDGKKDDLLKKLYKGLVVLKRNIADLEEAEVDWDDDDNSSYIKKVRFEKRACEIYEKICELTGESTHAHRIVKKPIKFKGTEFKQFNLKLQKIVNTRKSFPNFLDVLKCLDYCNKKYSFGLLQDQLKPFAQDAFEKLGKALQKRRKDDLYESTTFYVGKNKDPAKEDPELRSRLEKNKKFYSKYDDIINEFADKAQKVAADDVGEVSSTSKSEQPDESKEQSEDPIEKKDELVKATEDECDKNGATTTSLDEDDDLMILS